MCTWAVNTVVEHYLNKGKDVYGCSMDCSKAFDMVEWVALFQGLMKKGVKAISIRLLMNIYKDQFCDVRWNGRFSSRFPISNGVRQGSVTSPILFSCYVDKLIKLLRASKVGCRIADEYFGVFIYADDIFLLSASRPGLQAMVKICEDFSKEHNLKFSTNPNPEKSKTKGIIFSRKAIDKTKIAPIMLCEDPLPWRDSLKLLGNTLDSDNQMKTDNDMKRCKFIGKIHSLNQEFGFASPEIKMKLLNIYTTSFYGSSLYKLYTNQCDKLYHAYNICVRRTFSVPRRTHNYLIETISQCMHPKVMICARFVKFVESLNTCKKSSILLLIKMVQDDNSTVCGKNLSEISKLCKV